MFDKTGRSISDPTDEGPGSMEDSLIRKTDEILDAVADNPGEAGRTADQVEASDDPSCSEERARNVVPG